MRIEKDISMQLSPQKLLDCLLIKYNDLPKERYYDDQGCHPSNIKWGLTYIKDHGVCQEEDYPYMARRGHCMPKNNVIVI